MTKPITPGQQSKFFWLSCDEPNDDGGIHVYPSRTKPEWDDITGQWLGDDMNDDDAPMCVEGVRRMTGYRLRPSQAIRVQMTITSVHLARTP